MALNELPARPGLAQPLRYRVFLPARVVFVDLAGRHSVGLTEAGAAVPDAAADVKPQ